MCVRELNGKSAYARYLTHAWKVYPEAEILPPVRIRTYTHGPPGVGPAAGLPVLLRFPFGTEIRKGASA
ncbi:hypothetical protein GCM10010121_021580 [Streptomyces brasiliensis]|uniref:Uncharacterized protein n=1 Tax=Streptomyces brasiliensis TaxID=1954 RepID=A0A917KE47_9ACTN|nr:hypothetical protein GCM10010121_021580 [Streptomyces brasiliensis]